MFDWRVWLKILVLGGVCSFGASGLLMVVLNWDSIVEWNRQPSESSTELRAEYQSWMQLRRSLMERYICQDISISIEDESEQSSVSIEVINPKFELPATEVEMRILARAIAFDAVRCHEQIEEYDEIVIDITRQIDFGIHLRTTFTYTFSIDGFLD